MRQHAQRELLHLFTNGRLVTLNEIAEFKLNPVATGLVVSRIGLIWRLEGQGHFLGRLLIS